ncbi:tRNA 2'-phosphotransferase 1-like isoform X3 [Oculina patagonica]
MGDRRSQQDGASARNPKRNHNIQLSKALSYILRHGAAKEGLQMSQRFIFVEDLLKLRQFQRYSEDDIKRVVADNDKKRFALRNDPATDRLQIRANQGHTIEGLSRMSRNHIHFAPGEPGEEGVISGMRSSCEILVFINLRKALGDGFKFYRSSNNVILCPGNEQGFLPPEYFERVVQTRPRKELLFPAT